MAKQRKGLDELVERREQTTVGSDQSSRRAGKNRPSVQPTGLVGFKWRQAVPNPSLPATLSQTTLGPFHVISATPASPPHPHPSRAAPCCLTSLKCTSHRTFLPHRILQLTHSATLDEMLWVPGTRQMDILILEVTHVDLTHFGTE